MAIRQTCSVDRFVLVTEVTSNYKNLNSVLKWETLKWGRKCQIQHLYTLPLPFPNAFELTIFLLVSVLVRVNDWFIIFTFFIYEILFDSIGIVLIQMLGNWNMHQCFRGSFFFTFLSDLMERTLQTVIKLWVIDNAAVGPPHYTVSYSRYCIYIENEKCQIEIRIWTHKGHSIACRQAMDYL